MSTSLRGDHAQERWIGRVRRGAPSQVVTSRGVLYGGGQPIEYYTSQPSSAQWIALGVVPLLPEFTGDDATHRVLVGTGGTEQSAIASLKARLDNLFASSGAGGPIADPDRVASPPSDWFG